MIKIKNLSFSYGDKEVLRDISLSIPKGDLCGLLGRNGSGKTTLFKCCLNLLKYKHGSIIIDDKKIEDLSYRELSKLIAYLPQDHKVSFAWSVEEIILMGRSPHMRNILGLSSADYDRVADIMEFLGITQYSKASFNDLSGGERQLVMIGRALAQDTPIIFLDEPTSALDFDNQIMIWQKLKEISDKGTTVVVCTHDPNHILWFCKSIIALNLGELVAYGSTDEVLTSKLLSTIFFSNKYKIIDVDDQRVIYPLLNY